MSADPLSASTLQEPAPRTTIPCVPPQPLDRDPQAAVPFGSGKVAVQNTTLQARFNAQLDAAHDALRQLGSYLLGMPSPSDAVDIWGLIGMANRVFADGHAT